MALTKKDQDALEVALANRDVKEKLLDEMQALRDQFRAFLADLDVSPDLAKATFEDEFALEDVREGGKKTKL